MADRSISFNRGVMIQKHVPTGMKVYMYLDNPGHYLNLYGNEVPEALAEKAGFDVSLFAKQRFKREKMTEFESAMEKELALAEAEAKPVVLEERGGYVLIKKGLRAEVRDAEGNSMAEKPLPLEEAKLLMEILAPKAIVGKKALKPAPKAAEVETDASAS